MAAVLADDIFKCIFMNENVWIVLKISLKFVPKVRINNIPALVQIMAWRRSGDKPLSEPMMVSLLTHICVIRPQWVNSLAPGRFQFNFRQVIFKLILVNGGWGISYEIALRWMPLDFADDKSTLVQVMTWCLQATSHYLSQCWPRSLLPYGVIRPQWVDSSPPDKMAAVLADNIFKCIFLNENDRIPIPISLKLIPMSPIDNKPALVQVMAWHRLGDKPLIELMMTPFTDAHMQH